MHEGAAQSGAEPRLGEDTTDESEGEVSHYSARRQEILDNAATVFADASEVFGSLPTLKKRLEAWKASQGGELTPSCLHSTTASISFLPAGEAPAVGEEPLKSGLMCLG